MSSSILSFERLTSAPVFSSGLMMDKIPATSSRHALDILYSALAGVWFPGFISSHLTKSLDQKVFAWSKALKKSGIIVLVAKHEKSEIRD